METIDNNINQLDELEALRAQVAEFKARLDKQEIVNDRLLRDVVKGKVKSLRKLNLTVYILAAFGFLVIFLAFVIAKINPLPAVALGLIGVAEGVFSFWNLHKIAGVSEMSVLDAQTAMSDFVRREKWLNILEIPVVIAIVYWICVEVSGATIPADVPEDLVKDTFTGAWVGAMIGIGIVAYLFRRQFVIIRNIRRSITALKSESPD